MSLIRFRGLGAGTWGRSTRLAVALLMLGYAADAAQESEKAPPSADQQHEQLFLEKRFPAATTCKQCHPDHYREWSVSPHAYAQMSPVFNAMHATILKLTNGTNGDFCIRCHTPVGMNLEEPEFKSNMDRDPTSREGVTCIVCHRHSRGEAERKRRRDTENKPPRFYLGKSSGRLYLGEGRASDSVSGIEGRHELERVRDDPKYKVEAGRPIHTKEPFFQLDKSGFCGTCHDVNLVNGFRLEEAFSEFKTSPAARARVSCQDCHMGIQPGENKGYAHGPAACVGAKPTLKRIADCKEEEGEPTKPAKLTNHMFIGPDYSVVHPGIFPHNPEAAERFTLREWLTFRYEEGWGRKEFEEQRPDPSGFPDEWSSPTDRDAARRVLEDNLELLAEADAERKKLLRAGYKLGGFDPVRATDKELVFRVEVRNGTDGHGVPTGFDAERLVFLRVTVTDKDGQVVFVSGDLDRNGDVRDNHSLYVHNGERPLDKQLFSLQSRFVTRMVRGGEREQVLAVNYSPDPLPFLRPSTSSTILTGRPLGARKHKQNIEPLGSRWARYRIKGPGLAAGSPYSVNVKLIAGMVPVNLIYEIKDVGFDYDMSAREVAERVVDGHIVVGECDQGIVVGQTGDREECGEGGEAR